MRIRTLRTPRGRASGRRKVSTGVLLLLALFAGLIGFAPAASAHHPEIAANTSCVAGVHKVSYTATSWTSANNANGRHPNIVIAYSVDGGAFVNVGSGAFTQANGGTFSGTFDLPGATTGSVRVRATDVGSWESGASGNNPRTTAPIALTSPCAPPSTPSGVAVVQCQANKIVVTFTGVGAATTVDIRKNGVLVPGGTNVPVPVGQSTFDVPLAPSDENTSVTIGLDYAAASATDQSLQVPVDCLTPPAPAAVVQWTCGSNATVVLTNTGQESVTATIFKNGVAIHTAQAVPGTYEVPITAADENTSVTIKVTFSDAGTATDVIEVLDVDCTAPAPTIGSPVCAAGGLAITLGNVEGDEVATFTVVVDGVQSTETVAAGTTKQILVPVAEDATVSLSISSGAVSYSNQALLRDCEKPAATVVFDCAVGGVRVALTNSGTDPATVDVNGEQVDVPAGTTAGAPVVRIIPVAEGAAYDITVLGVNASGTRDCEKPAATVVFDCAVGGVSVSVTNAGELPTTVNVNGNPVVVQPGVPYNTVIPVAEGADYDVVVTGDDGLDVGASGTRDCEQPVASVTFECAAGGVVVKLTNSGELPTTVDVDGEQVEVPAGTTAENPVTRVIPVAEGAAYDITVLGENAEGVRDCEKPAATVVFDCAVGGVSVSVTNAGELPTTVNVNGNPVVVQPGVPYSTVIPVAEGADYDVVVTGDDGLDVGASGTRDCEQPALGSVTLDCAEGGVVVVLTNTGELPASVTVDGDEAVIPAGGSIEVVVPVAENATYDFDVVIDGSTSTFTGARDCEQPGLVSALVECAQGGVVVVLSNTGESDTTVTVDGVEVLVPAGGTAEVLVPVAENAEYDFTVEGDELSEQVSGTLDCEIPQVESIQIECAEGGVVVIITNDGELPTTVTVDGVDHEIPAGETVEILVEIEENEQYSFLVEGDGIEQLVEGTYDCDLPEPSVDDDVVCAAGGLGLVLRNTGDDTATFTITSPALADGSVEAVLEAGDVETVLIPLAEDASTQVAVTSGGETLFDDTLTRDCEEVEGDSTTPPTSVGGTTTLPRTGSDAQRLLALAGALLLAGAAMAFGGRRQAELA